MDKSIDPLGQLATILGPFLGGGERLSWPFLITFGLVGWWLYTGRERSKGNNQGFLAYLLPTEVYLHPDAIRTYILVILNGLLHLVINLSVLIFSVTKIASITKAGLVSALGPGPELAIGFAAIIGFSIALFVVQDFAFWAIHYAFHKVPFLWEFHKVHHCPEVLTPVTDRQFHPLETIGKGLAVSVIVGPLIGLTYYLFGSQPPEVTIMGIAALTVLVNIWGNFRHSHIWIQFPRWLSYIVSSPAMHHIHHSKDERHWDKNLAVALSLWDHLFGTLYIPEEREQIEFGVAGMPEDEFNSVAKLYARPIQRSLQLLWPQRTTPSQLPATE